jgi:hypothetical protein
LTTIHLERYLERLTGNTEIADSLQRLDKLTQEEAKMASAELLRITHNVEGRVMDANDRIQVVDGKVQGVDDKLDDVNRSSSLRPSCLSFRMLRPIHRKPNPR